MYVYLHRSVTTQRTTPSMMVDKRSNIYLHIRQKAPCIVRLYQASLNMNVAGVGGWTWSQPCLDVGVDK